MITIISGTNRKDAKTHIFAKQYTESIRSKTSEIVNYISLEEVQDVILHSDMYNPEAMNDGLKDLQEKTIIPADKFVFLVPEYNGSYPGIVKLFIDAISIRKYKDNFVGKKALLVGVASGRAGCLRGLDDLTGCLNHVGVNVMPNKLPISSIGAILDDADNINETTQSVINNHIDSFLKF